MLQFTAEDALYKIYSDTIGFFEERLYGIEPDLSKKLEILKKTPGEYCNDLVQEFRGNVTGRPVESIKNYTENLYYDLIYKLLKIRDLHFEYLKRFGMDSDNERLANDFMGPLSILVTNIWRAGRLLHIAELKEFSNVDIEADFDLNGDYKPLLNYVECAKKEPEGQVVIASTPSTSNLITKRALSEVKQETTDQHYKSFIELFKKPEDVKPCVEVLNNYENGRNREGKIKRFVFVAWIDCLSRVNKIHTNKYELVAPVLSNEFDGYSISRSTWYEPGTGYEQAKEHFIINIPR